MTKLLNIWMLKPSLANARKLRSYAVKHQMAACMLTANDQRLLAFALSQAEHDI
jgi:hypothetical protein